MSWSPFQLIADRLRPPQPAAERRDWASDDDDAWSGVRTSAGVPVNRDSAMRLSTVWACVRLLTNTIATLPADIIVSLGRVRFAVDRPEERPFWLGQPDPADPTMTATEHFAQVATSLLLDGNFFTYVEGDVMTPTALIVLDPRRVNVKSDGRTPVYEIVDDMGRVQSTVGPMRMLHGSWLRQPGALRGISPVEAARQGIGLGLVAEDFGARFFGQGTTLSYGVEVPGTMTDQQREDFRANLTRRTAGVRNAHSVSVITNGAKFVPGLGLTNDQAQFLELRKFQVEDVARWFGVPPHMVGSQEPGASSYNSVEQRSLEFRQYAVLPLVRRIEDPYQRLVELPDRLRSSQVASASFRFNLDGIARADIKTRFEAYSAGIMAGVLKPDEARSLEDLAPVPGGNVTYMQQQMVPLGTPPEPKAPPPPPAPAPPTRSDETPGDDLLRSAVAAALVPAPAPVFNLTMPTIENVLPPTPIEVRNEITVPPTPVEVHNEVNVPEQRAEVTVNVPEGPRPVVNVTTPKVQDIRVIETPPARLRVQRNAQGQIVEVNEP